MAARSIPMMVHAHCSTMGAVMVREDLRFRGGGMDERWKELAVAIIERAVADYQRGGPQVKAECARFFLGSWFYILSNGADGWRVLERLDK